MDPYPYETDPTRHEYAWALFNAAGIRHDIDACDALAKHLFDDLGCGPPGTTHEPRVKYDSLGGSGAPWELGSWIPVDEDRVTVTATAPVVDVTAMTDEEAAEWQAALDARRDALRADATTRNSDASGEG